MLARPLQSIRFNSRNNRIEVLPRFTKSPNSPHLLVSFTNLPAYGITDPKFRQQEPGLVSDSESKDVGSHHHFSIQHGYDIHFRFKHRLRIHNLAARTNFVSACDPVEDVPE
jgi:hypothetical protein